MKRAFHAFCIPFYCWNKSGKSTRAHALYEAPTVAELSTLFVLHPCRLGDLQPLKLGESEVHGGQEVGADKWVDHPCHLYAPDPWQWSESHLLKSSSAEVESMAGYIRMSCHGLL